MGYTIDDIAKELGIPSSCKVAAGAGDNAAAAVGTGIVSDGKAYVKAALRRNNFTADRCYLLFARAGGKTQQNRNYQKYRNNLFHNKFLRNFANVIIHYNLFFCNSGF